MPLAIHSQSGVQRQGVVLRGLVRLIGFDGSDRPIGQTSDGLFDWGGQGERRRTQIGAGHLSIDRVVAGSQGRLCLMDHVVQRGAG
jgi:hypothetical protein